MGRTGHGQADSRGLLRGVALSEAEKTSIKAINEKYRAQGQELRGATRPAREEMREKARALMEQRRTELRAALTAENQKTFDANAKEMQSRRAEWAKKRRDGRS